MDFILKVKFKLLALGLFFSLFVSCDFGIVDIMSEREYRDNVGLPSLNVEITLSSEIETFRYIEEIVITIDLSSDRASRYDIQDISFTSYNCMLGSVTSDQNDDSVFYMIVYPTGGDIEIMIPAEELDTNSGHTNYDDSNLLKIEEGHIIDIGSLEDLTWINGTDVLGIDSSGSILWGIDPERETVSEIRKLKNDYPLAMDYCKVENKLYVISQFGDYIDIYNLDDGTVESLYIAEAVSSRGDIKIDSTSRRIYLLKTYNILIIDMDDGSVLNTESVDYDVSSLAYDNTGQLLYAGDSDINSSSIYRYDVSIDTFVLEETLADVGDSGTSLVLSPDGSVIAFPCSRGNAAGTGGVDAFAASDFSNLLGNWQVGYNPNMIFFNPVKDILYSTNYNSGDNHLYVMSSTDFSMIRMLEFKGTKDAEDAEGIVLFSTNMSGTAAVGYVMEDSGMNRLHFFTDID